MGTTYKKKSKAKANKVTNDGSYKQIPNEPSVN